MFIKKLDKKFIKSLKGQRYLVINNEEIFFNCNKEALNIIIKFLPCLPVDSKIIIRDFDSYKEKCKITSKGEFVKEYPTPVSQEELVQYCCKKPSSLCLEWKENGKNECRSLYEIDFPLLFEGREYEVTSRGINLGVIKE